MIALVLLASQLSFAETTPAGNTPPPAPSTAATDDIDIQGSIVPPTAQQKKHVRDAVKKAQKKTDCKAHPDKPECKKQ